MRRAYAMAALCLATGLVSAQERPTAGNPHPLHAPRLRLDPVRAFQHIEQGAERMRAHRAARLQHAEHGDPGSQPPLPPTPARRPTGAGRHIAAVVACADGDFDVSALLLQRRPDLLILANPGPVLRRDEIALLERSIETERLPLCIVLVHDDCPTAEAREHTRSARRPLSSREYGEIVARHLLRQSRLAQQAQRLGRFEVVVGHVAANGDITWHAEALEAPPLGRGAPAPRPEPDPTHASPAVEGEPASPPARPARH
ncbi:MAG: hypothetical protein KDB80_11570 [Planctomycetes bacterium]|nr:hypothetical protein [Planctomycetota bacterium]